ncbi:MAG: YkgJ family cysteine cluster protein [Gammaproteobacteria bacterium]|nr:MAG: YkgJ family cysteine cluster protein [Gammaproteobacteria bacterium]
MPMNGGSFDLPCNNPVVPAMLDDDFEISFNCYPGISCFNACCKQSDITLAPYDIIRLKKRLGMDSSEFLKKHTVPFEMDQHGMPGVKLRNVDGELPICQFMTEAGCSVYEDRPTACRYYPLGLLSLKKKGEKSDEVHYALVEEDHCKGHGEDRKLTVGEYRKEQGVIDYDEMNRDWHRIILKKRSAGPAIGTPPEMSFQLFFMASYDLDRFRRFVLSESFRKMYGLDEAFFGSIREDDIELLKFGYKLMMQIFFGEMSVPMVDKAVEKRLAERGEVIAMRRAAEKKAWQEKQETLKRDFNIREGGPVVNVCGGGRCGAND